MHIYTHQYRHVQKARTDLVVGALSAVWDSWRANATHSMRRVRITHVDRAGNLAYTRYSFVSGLLSTNQYFSLRTHLLFKG